MGAPHSRTRGWLVAYTYSDGEPRFTLNGEMASTRTLPTCTWWEPDMAGAVGMDDGVAHRMDRLKALGNGQVPAVVRAAWELLSA